MSAEIVTIASPDLTAEVNPFGAELWRLRDRQGRDLLWDGDSAWWTGRAPLLFPIIGRLPDDRFSHQGQVYELPKHGFARRRAFELVRQEPDLATFQLTADADTRAAYPFDFVLTAEFALAGPELRMSVTVANAGPEPMPATFGFHPAFRWPLPDAGARAAHRIDFADPESGPLRALDSAGLLGAERLASPIDGRRLALRDELFVADALIFEAPRSRKLQYGGEGGPALTIAWEGADHLGVWTKPGAGYVCVEPWHSLPAETTAAGEILSRSDLAILPPGDARAFAMTVSLG
ncbi:aldose 1-epimerase family protein [Phenylobacterium sp. LjRoot219]|uniref:aldose 1-epimerase family protein n=1 Tax=Phenylobacterium sp. LjRoot219 TaxID=3342283 RepID=UPI003ED0003A